MRSNLLLLVIFIVCCSGLSFAQLPTEQQRQQAVNDANQAASQAEAVASEGRQRLLETAARNRARNAQLSQAGFDALDRAIESANQSLQETTQIHDANRNAFISGFDRFMEPIHAQRTPWWPSFSSEPQETQPSSEQPTADQPANTNGSPINFTDKLPPMNLGLREPIAFSDQINPEDFFAPASGATPLPQASASVGEDSSVPMWKQQMADPRNMSFYNVPLVKFDDLPKPVQDFIAPPGCDPFVRWGGAAEFGIGAAAVVGSGTAATLTAPSVIVSGVFGLGVFKGADHVVTGYRQFLTCERQDTGTYTAAKTLTGSDTVASVVDAGTDLAPVIYAGGQAVGQFARNALRQPKNSLSELMSPNEATRYQDYWKNLTKNAPEIANPYEIIPKYDINGNLKSVTTYDVWGFRAYQYETPFSLQHGEGYHIYDQRLPLGAGGKGPRSEHHPYDYFDVIP